MSIVVRPRMRDGDWNPGTETYGPDQPKDMRDRDGSVWFECEVLNPPSMEGRTVWVRVNPDQVTAMVKMFRQHAIAARSTPMPSRPAPYDPAIQPL